MRLSDRPYREWSIARANAALYTRPHIEAEVRALATCPGLAPYLRNALSGHLTRLPDPEADIDSSRLVGPN